MSAPEPTAETPLTSASAPAQLAAAAMDLARALWELAYGKEQNPRKILRNGLLVPTVEYAVWRERFLHNTLSDDVAAARVTVLTAAESVTADSGAHGIPVALLAPVANASDDVRIAFDALAPLRLAYVCLGPPPPRCGSEREYLLWRNLRRTHQCDSSPTFTHLFHLLAAEIDTLAELRQEPECDYRKELVPRLEAIVRPISAQSHGVGQHLETFLECCRMVRYLSPALSPGRVRFRAERVDAEFLLSNLFGLPTDITGFDALFGGGGLALAERREFETPTPAGRAILVRGRFGSGKSSLALSLAAEVARKAGLAWVVTLEQSAAECLHYLASTRALETTGELQVHTDSLATARLMLPHPVTARQPEQAEDKGALVMLGGAKESLDQLLLNLVERAERTRHWSLRLLVVDPVSAIIDLDRAGSRELRAKLMAALDRVKEAGANLLLVAESDTRDRSSLRFIDNVVDTVIELSTDERHGYNQRFIEVIKSRLQREQRGRHPFSIKAGHGLNIFPSSAALHARIRDRRARPGGEPGPFGWKPLDDALGPDAIFPGDVTVFRGGEGTFKTHLALLFAFGADSAAGDTTPRRSLLLPVSDSRDTLETLLRSESFAAHRTGKPYSVVELPGGFAQPGRILQLVGQEFEKARSAGEIIDRVIIDNVGHWEIACPFLREDEIFGDTLVALLRRNGTSSLFICGETLDYKGSAVQRSIVDGANTLVDFLRLKIKGRLAPTFSVVKTRGMRHRPEPYEIELNPSGLHIAPLSPLHRVGPAGELSTVKTQLYLHEDNSLHAEYNQRIQESLRPVLSRELDVNSKDRTSLIRALELGPLSTVDELQIVQLDEFQLPEVLSHRGTEPLLRLFPLTDWVAELWKDLDPNIRERLQPAGSGDFAALPFYDNLSLLTVRRDFLNEPGKGHHSTVRDWRLIAEAAAAWEQTGRGEDEVFFDFPTEIPEHYNCLFLEIALGLGVAPIGANRERLEEWLGSAGVVEACRIFRALAQRKHRLALRKPNPETLRSAAAGSIIGRHWFTTLNQLIKDQPALAGELEVRALPGDICVAGEWYLAVPAYSAAPEIALRIIRVLTTPQAEEERLRLGVGLPTRVPFYHVEGGVEGTEPELPSRYLPGLPLHTVGELLRHAFRRSSIHGYARVTPALALHLQQILEIDDGLDPAAVEQAIAQRLASLKQQVQSLLPPQKTK